MNALVNALLVFLSVSGLYITFTSSWSSVYRAVLLLHPATGLLSGLLFFFYILSHYSKTLKQNVRPKTVFFIFCGVSLPVFLHYFSGVRAFLVFGGLIFLVLYLRFTLRLLRLPLPLPQRAAVFFGQILLAVFFALFATGVLMLPGAAHNTNLILWHRYAGFLFSAVFLLHVTRLLFMREHYAVAFLRFRRFFLPALAACIVLLLLYQGKGQVKFIEFRVNIHDALEGGEKHALINTKALTQMESCGSVTACHKDIVNHYKHSNHFLSPESPHFQKIVRLLKTERGEDAARFCMSCHAPHKAVSENEGMKDNHGMSCTACHALDAAHLVPFGKHGKKGFTHHGYAMRLNTAHLSMFETVDKKERLAPLNEYLIKLNPLGHGRVFMTPFMKTDAFCLSCHQEHIPPLAREDVVRPNCAYCHMQLQLSFVKGKHIVKKAHYFAGANIITPRVLGDKEGYSVVRGWLTGYFKTEALDSYWELRKAAGEPPEKATWLVMTMEPLTSPSPGKTCKIKIFTSNPGIGHPFPTGVIDMYDVWMEFKVSDENGNLIYKNGASGERPYEKTSTHWLGGYFYDAENKPILKHRVWEKKGAVRKWVEPGKTLEDIFTFAVPAKLKGQNYIVVEAQLNYGRLNRDFAAWAYGNAFDFPPVPVVSVKQRIPVEPGS